MRPADRYRVRTCFMPHLAGPILQHHRFVLCASRPDAGVRVVVCSQNSSAASRAGRRTRLPIASVPTGVPRAFERWRGYLRSTLRFAPESPRTGNEVLPTIPQMRCATGSGNNHLITVLFSAFGEAEQFVWGAVGGDDFNMMRNVQIEDFGGELGGGWQSGSLWTPSRWRHAPDYCGKTCV